MPIVTFLVWDDTGAVTVLHTHNRRLDFHPHVHLVMPAVAFDSGQRLWRNKDSGFLFDHKELAKVFRAKMLDGIKRAGLKLPEQYPEDCCTEDSSATDNACRSTGKV